MLQGVRSSQPCLTTLTPSVTLTAHYKLQCLGCIKACMPLSLAGALSSLLPYLTPCCCKGALCHCIQGTSPEVSSPALDFSVHLHLPPRILLTLLGNCLLHCCHSGSFPEVTRA